MKQRSRIRSAVEAPAAALMLCALVACGGGGGSGGASVVPPGPTPTPAATGTFPRTISLQLDRSTAPVGTATTLSLTARALDDFGNLIKGTYAPAITIANDDTSGQVTVDKTTLTGAADAITVRYTGKLLQKPPVTFTVTGPGPGNPAVFTPDAWTRYGPATYPAIFATTVGPDGNIWFTECGVLAGATCKLGKVSPSTGILTESSDVGYANGLVAGPDGNVWFTEGRRNFIGRMTPSGTVTEFPIPSGAPGNGSDAGPIVVGPDNNIWFAEGDRIGVVTLATGAITEYPIGGLFRPSSLVVGTDGALWFSEVQQIGRITTAGSVTQFTVDASGMHRPGTLVFGPSSTMYFPANPGAAAIWSMTTGGAVNRTPLTPPGASFDPALGTAAGVMWGVGGMNDPQAYASANGIASLSFAGTWTLYISLPPIPFGSTVGVSHGVLGPDANLWFADGQGMVRFRLAL
jgi:streptogramin lyase